MPRRAINIFIGLSVALISTEIKHKCLVAVRHCIRKRYL